MPTIYIDEQVKSELNQKATSGLTPNDVIRQILGLSVVNNEEAREPGVYLIPHSSKEFENANKLREWLSDRLAWDGEYDVASQHYWKNVLSDSICIFHKDKTIVGEGKMLGGLKPYLGTDVSPETGRPYAGTVYFKPSSVKVYEKPISFAAAEKLLGKNLTFRGVQKLTKKDYDIIHEACT